MKFSIGKLLNKKIGGKKMEENKSMEEMLDEEIDFWNPAEGDKLIGEFQGVRHKVGKFASDVYIIKTDIGFVGVWGAKIIADKLKDVKPGTKVGVKFLGIKKGDAGEYKNYKVIVEEKPEQ
jgi:hypothetical protein